MVSIKTTIAKAIQKRQNEEFKKINGAQFYLEMSTYHRAWLIEILNRCEDIVSIKPFALYMIADWYQDKADKEVAIIMAMLLTNGTYANILAQTKILVRILGEKPYEWIKSREFASLSSGSRKNNEVTKNGLTAGEIAAHAQIIWEILEQYDSIEQYVVASKKEPIEIMYETFGRSIECSKQYKIWKLSIMLLRLSCNKRAGLGLWKDAYIDVFPLTMKTKNFLYIYGPGTATPESIDGIVELMGLEGKSEMFCLFAAYYNLRSQKKAKMEKIENVFMRAKKRRITLREIAASTVRSKLKEILE